MKNHEFKKYIYVGITAVSVIAICIVFWYCIIKWDSVAGVIRTILRIAAPIIYGAVLAYLLAPTYNKVRAAVDRGFSSKIKHEKYLTALSKACATTASLILVILVVASLFQMLIPQIVESLLGIKESFPIYLQNLYQWVQQLLSDNVEIEQTVLSYMQSGVTYLEEWVSRAVMNFDMNRIKELLTGVSASLINVVVFVKNWLIGLIVMVYLLNIKDVLAAQSKKIIYGAFELRWANAIVDEMRLIHRIFGGFIIGKLLDSLIIAIICFVGTSLLKMPFALLVSVIVGVTNIIPFFGPFIGAIPSGFLILLVSPIKCLYFLLFILLLQQFDGNILGPKILGDSTGLSSFWVLFSILIFGGLFGFVGMIIAVPAFAVIYDLIARGVNSSLRKKSLSQNTDDYKELSHIDERDKKFIK